MASFDKSRNIIFICMLIGIFLGYLPWYNFSAVSKYISNDLNLSVNQTGMIISSFQLGYVIVVLFTGWLADRIGNKRVLAWATLSTAVSATAFPFLAEDFISVLVLRLITGLSAGAIYIPGVALLSNWYPPNKRGGAIGAYTGSMALAYAGGYFIAAPIAAAYNWRIGMFWTSLPAFIAAFLIFIFVKEGPKEKLALKKESEINDHKIKEKAEEKNTIEDIAGPVLMTTGYMGHMWELYAFWGWIGPYMVACSLAVGYEMEKAVSLGGLLAALIILLGAPSVWLAGLVADKIGKAKTIIYSALSSLLFQFIFGYLYGMSLVLVVLVGLWIGFWVLADSSIYKASITEMVVKNKRGTALGVQSALGFSMTIISPYVFGVILEKANQGIQDATQATNWGLPFLVLGVGALFAPISMIILKYVKNKNYKQ